MKRSMTGLVGCGLAMLVAGSVVGDTLEFGPSTWHRIEYRASSFAVSRQEQVDLAARADGSLDVVWASRRQREGHYAVMTQRFDADGRPIGVESFVQTAGVGHQRAPSIAAGPDGPWIAWQGQEPGALGSRIWLRGPAGSAAQMVDVDATGDQTNPVLTALPDGGVLLLMTVTSDLNETRVRGRRFGADGGPRGSSFGLCDDPSLDTRSASAAVAADGSFHVLYCAGEPGDPGTTVCLQRFNPDGDPVGSPRTLAQRAIEPVLARDGDDLVVAWLYSDGDDWALHARRFDASGAARETEHVVCASNASGAAICALPEGGVVIAWNSPDGDGNGIFGRYWNTVFGPVRRLTRHDAGDQALRAAIGTRRLIATSRGDLLLGWSGDTGAGDASAANVTRLSRTARPDGGGVTTAMIDGAGLHRPLRTATPHVPPDFDPRRINKGQRTVTAGAGELGFTGIFSTGWTPPDPAMAVGPAHLVLMTNGAIAFAEKDGTITFEDEIEGSFGFWGSVGASGFVFDPEVVYDPQSERFFAMAAEANAPPGGNRSYVLLAVSDDSDPNGAWHRYRLETTALAGNLFDSPNLCVGPDAVVVTGDGFGIGANYSVFAWDKASLLAGVAPVLATQTTLPTSTQSAGIPPVYVEDLPAFYMIEHREGVTNTAVRLIALRDVLGSPTFTTVNLTVPSYGRPEDPPQAGTSVRPESFDARFWSVAWHDGSLWATHHADADRVLAHWYEVAMNGWPTSGQQPELVQSGVIDPGPGIRTFFSSITVDACGRAAICYSRSSFSEFIGMATSERYAGDTPGTFRPSVLRAVSESGDTSGRWGDYSAIKPDPVALGTLWAFHEVKVGGSWSTWVARLEGTYPPADLTCDGLVGFDDLVALLASWGPCPGCSADLDGDGEVGFTDLLVVLGAWTG